MALSDTVDHHIEELVNSGYGDHYIVKSLILHHGLGTSESQRRLNRVRETKIKSDAHQDDDEHQFDSDLGSALGLDWPDHD